MNFSEKLDILFEIHYEDIYGKEFVNFRKKYSKRIKEYDLYVNFTDYSYDPLDKSFSQDPTHHDPIGLYAYPLAYVIKHPADIWYGKGSKYLRIIKDRSKHKVKFPYWPSSEVTIYSDFKKLGYDYRQIRSHMDFINFRFKDRLKPKITGYYSRLFLQMLQIKFQEHYDFDKKKDTFEVLSGKEQTKLLLKMGIDCLEDRGNAKNATINPREPEQIVFLRPHAFDIVETFVLGGKKGTSTSQVPSTSDEGEKLAVQIFKEFGHRIKKFVKESGNYAYISDKGFIFKVDFDFPEYVMRTRRMGEKKHKERTLSTYYFPRIELITDRGTIKRRGDSASKYSEFATDMHSEYLTKEPLPDWQPVTPESYIQNVKDEREKATEEYRQKENEKRVKYAKSDIEHFISKLFEHFMHKPLIIQNDIEALDVALYFNYFLGRHGYRSAFNENEEFSKELMMEKLNSREEKFIEMDNKELESVVIDCILKITQALVDKGYKTKDWWDLGQIFRIFFEENN